MAETFHTNLFDILKMLRSVNPADGSDGQDAYQETTDAARVIQFLRKNNLWDKPADFASSLILMQADEQQQIRAGLNLTPNISQLPPLERTGTSPPFMYGHLLSYEDHVVTDADLQRAWCLFMTKEAAIQEWINLLVRIVGAAAETDSEQWPKIHKSGVRGPYSREEDTASWWPEVQDLLEIGREIESKKAMDRPTIDLVKDKIMGVLKVFVDDVFVQANKDQAERIENHLQGRLDSLLKEKSQSKEKAPITSSLLNDLLTAFAIASKEHLREQRHLGKSRIRPIYYQKPDVSNIVIQGAGDLSMNPWNIAFYWPGERRENVPGPTPIPENNSGQPQVYIPPREPYASRTYHCLVVWKEGDQKELQTVIDAIKGDEHRDPLGVTIGRDLSIIALKISPGIPYLHLPGQSSAGATLYKLVQFAVYGKLVLRKGNLVDRVEVIDEFQDLRHVFRLPNINPKNIPDSSGAAEFVKNREHLLKRPRDIFGQLQYDDLWLFEHALLSDRNLRQLACKAPIAIDLARLGAQREWIDFCLKLDGYQKQDHYTKVTAEGDFAWDDQDFSNPVLNVRLKLNTYPCTIVGIGNPNSKDRDSNTLYLLAWGHDFKYGGHTIWDCARVLQAAGARYALVVDEGKDVFQCVFKGQSAPEFLDAEKKCGDLVRFFTVPLSSSRENNTIERRGLRASLAFWQESRKGIQRGKK